MVPIVIISDQQVRAPLTIFHHLSDRHIGCLIKGVIVVGTDLSHRGLSLERKGGSEGGRGGGEQGSELERSNGEGQGERQGGREGGKDVHASSPSGTSSPWNTGRE
jgi:hypothetical protein